MVDDAYIQTLEKAGWPQEFHEKLRVGNLKSTVGIATLWTYQDVVHKDLDPESYAVIGNYYDRRNAFEPFIRNCLANPNIRHVILLGNDKAGSREVLVNFFEKGIADGNVAGTDCPVPELIPLEDLEAVRTNVTLHDLTDQIADLDDTSAYATAIGGVLKDIPDAQEPYAQPRLYDKPEIATDHYPSEKTGLIVRGESVGATWLKILRTVYDYGLITKMKEKDSTQIRLVHDLVAVVDGKEPDASKFEEYFRFDKAYLESYFDEICTDKVPAGTLYTYGSRLRGWNARGESMQGKKIDQIADIIEYLKNDKLRTSAVALTWVVEDELTRRILNKDKNSPCILLVQPFTVDGKLTLTAYIRSNDMFRAWPLNALGLRKLQGIIAEGLQMEVGPLTTISMSAHLYEDNWKDALAILEKHYTSTNCFFDPRGYYAISLKEENIHVQHFSPDSQLLKEYDGKTARELNDAINSSQHSVDPYHVSYLGEELMKAEIALGLGIPYTQDEKLDFSQLKK